MTLPLKEATAEKHKIAERMPFNIKMFRGQLSGNAYLMYLYQQLALFKAMEERELPHASLARTNAIEADINELNAKEHAAGETLPGTHAYAGYLSSLSDEELLPHIYLNYMAIMFGGQMMKKSVPSAGKMYDFDHMQEAVASIRAVQQDAWADEVNKGFDFIIAMFDELEARTMQEELS